LQAHEKKKEMKKIEEKERERFAAAKAREARSNPEED